MRIIGEPAGEGAVPLAEPGPGGPAPAVRSGWHKQTGRFLDERDPAQEVTVRLTVDLLHPAQGIIAIVLVALGLAALERMRSDDPEKAVHSAQAFDVHLAVGPGRQVDEPVEGEMPMLAKSDVPDPPQPLDAGGLVAGEKEIVADARDCG